MQARFVTKVEKNVDQSASVLFGVACGYSAYLWLGTLGRLGAPAVVALAAAITLLAYLLSFRMLSAVQPETRKLPVREFRLREVEPLEPEDFEPAEFVPLDSGRALALLAAPVAAEVEELLLTEQVASPVADAEQVELLLTDAFEVEKMEVPPSLERAEPEPMDPVEVASPVEGQRSLLAEFGPESRVVRLFDAAAMPTPGQLGSQIDRHLDGEPAAVQSAEAAQALQDALAELRRSIPNRRG